MKKEASGGMSIYLDSETLHELQAYQQRIREQVGVEVAIPALARHCINNWAGQHRPPGKPFSTTH